jgi:hypothetical protein
MLLDMNPVRIERISGNEDDPFCLEDSIATYAHWIGRDYELMFMNSWDFNYALPDETNSSLIGERIFFDDNNNASQSFSQLLENYHGIKLSRLNSNSIQEEILNTQSELIAERPLLLVADVFWCPWAIGFQKYHGSHVYLINGLDDQIAGFLCVDCFNLTSFLSLPLINFMKGRTNLGRFTIFDEPVINPDDIINSVYMIATKLLGGEKTANSFNHMRELANEINQNFDIRRELGGQTAYQNTFLWKGIFEIALRRTKFALLLKYISKKFSSREDFYLEMSLHFKESMFMWYKILSMLGKIFLINKPDTDIIRRLASSIKDVADYEEKLAYRLLA